MGESQNLYSTLDMKFLVVLSLAVAGCLCAPEAEPEADALYGYYGYGLGYHGLGYRAYGGYYPYHRYGHYYGKRSADAEPEADALYGYYGYGGYRYGGYRGYFGYPGYRYYGK